MNDPAFDGTLMLVGVIFSILLLIVVVMWIVFPIVTYYQLRRVDEALQKLTLDMGEIKAHLLEAMPDARMIVPCGTCDGQVRYHQRQSGATIRCPHCNTEIVLP
jgi:DNA-directed RNA polymerase subunit RPC12/RpoP